MESSPALEEEKNEGTQRYFSLSVMSGEAGIVSLIKTSAGF